MQVIRHAERPAPLQVVGDAVTPLVRAPSHELHELAGPVRSGPPPHAHPWSESYYVLSGALMVAVGDEGCVLRGGDVVTVPPGTVHLFRIEEEGTRFLVFTDGASAGAFFEDVHAHVPHGPPTPEVMPVLIEVARRNRLTSPLFG